MTGNTYELSLPTITISGIPADYGPGLVIEIGVSALVVFLPRSEHWSSDRDLFQYSAKVSGQSRGLDLCVRTASETSVGQVRAFREDLGRIVEQGVGQATLQCDERSFELRVTAEPRALVILGEPRAMVANGFIRTIFLDWERNTWPPDVETIQTLEQSFRPFESRSEFLFLVPRTEIAALLVGLDNALTAGAALQERFR